MVFGGRFVVSYSRCKEYEKKLRINGWCCSKDIERTLVCLKEDQVKERDIIKF